MHLFPHDGLIAINWHRPVWYGRVQPSRPRMATDLRRKGYKPKWPAPEDYRLLKQAKFARRFLAAERGERAFPLPH